MLYSPSHAGKVGLFVALAAFDTLSFANQLKNAGVPPAHAEAQAEALAEVFETHLQQLATKADLRELELKLESKIDKGFAEIKGEMLLLKWMFGVLVAGVATLIAKAFF
nr:DUF1640 domain-containing protein [Xylella taiwanensis]